tara:strand:- start:387 stop:716 length:330 start_codon:yes stop_codon:yes gene_type:complete
MDEYYKLLNATPDMSTKEIKKRYIQLMKKNHPDRSGQDDKCKEMTAAYQNIIKRKIIKRNENLPICDKIVIPEILLLENKKKSKNIFKKVFDFFFEYDSDDSSDSSDSD